MKTIFMMIGHTGSGKSTFAQKMAVVEHAFHINVDTIFKRLYSKGLSLTVASNMYERYKNSIILICENVILEENFISKEKRQFVINEIKTNYSDSKIIAVYMDTSIDESIERSFKRDKIDPDLLDVYKSNYKSTLDIPTIDEGFSEIWTVKENRYVTKMTLQT